MFILVFSGMIALVELYVLGLHESRRNQQERAETGRRSPRCYHHLCGGTNPPLETVFSPPVNISSREALDKLALLKSTPATRQPFDHWDRLM